MPLPEEGIGDVSTVELADWQKVQEGDEEAEPARVADRMEGDGRLTRIDAEDEPGEDVEEYGIPQFDCQARGRRYCRFHFGEPEAHHHRRQCDDHASPWAGRADIEECAPIPGDAVHPDERAEGADREGWAGDEVGQRRGHPVSTSEDVVAELVAEQDGQQRE